MSRIYFVPILIVAGLATVSIVSVIQLKRDGNLKSTEYLKDDFSQNKTIEEAGSIEETVDGNWWVNSGGILDVKDGIASTNIGEIDQDNKWKKLYAISNPNDTNNGYYPQNILRLILTSKWKNFSQETYFKVLRINPSLSENKNESNGLLLLNRYINSDNLYYTGLRVDGFAVIKKKINGTYYTLETQQVLLGIYDKEKLPNLIPLNTWIGIKSEIKDLSNGKVEIKLYLDINKTGKWELAASAIDDGKKFGGAPIIDPGYAGIRTDFMDVSFDDYKIEIIK